MRTDQQLNFSNNHFEGSADHKAGYSANQRAGYSAEQHRGYQVTMTDSTIENVGGADAYAQEGPLTTFFDTGGRDVVDSWAVRLMSLRTADIAKVKRTGPRPFVPVLPITMAS